MYNSSFKTFYKFDSLLHLTENLDSDQVVSIIDSDSGLYINCKVFTLRNELRFLMKYEMQVFDERPYTFYL